MRTILTVLLLLAVTTLSHAAREPLKTFVNDFTVIGAPNGTELKAVLPAILSSRLNPEILTPVGKQESADIMILGSYVVFGKIFTLDATVKSADSTLYLKAIEQGEKEEEIPAALSRLAEKISAAVSKATASLQAKNPVMPPLPQAVAAAPPTATPHPLIQSRVIQPAGTATPVFKEKWSSQPLEGALTGIAAGKRLTGGDREIFVAAERALHYYRMGKELKQIARIELPHSFKIIGIDAADLDGDGITEIYLTALDRGTLASQVFSQNDGKLEKIAESLPYFFRSMITGSTTPQIFVQEMGMNTDYYGDIAELVKTGATFRTKNPLKLPESANIYNFGRFEADTAKTMVAVLTSEGYLTVQSDKGDEIWQSVDRFGGSETFFKREAPEQQRSNLGDEFRWVFLQQRIFAVADGSLLIPRNEGTFVVGNMKEYNKYSFHLLTWSGSAFREQSSSGQRAGYLADYAFDPMAKELITLEVTRKEGLTTKGRSVITVLTLEP